MGLVYFSVGAESYPAVQTGLSPGGPSPNLAQGRSPSIGAWAIRAPLPIDAFGVAVAGDGTYAYTFGGYSFSVPGAINQVSRYDPVADTLTALASIPGNSATGRMLLDFDGDLYGRTLRIAFISRLRGERRFPGVKELIAQMHRDVEAARELCASFTPP